MADFINWFGNELLTEGSVGRIGFKLLLLLFVVWIIMTIRENT
ncbi:hypothetical protein [Treponema sp.]